MKIHWNVVLCWLSTLNVVMPMSMPTLQQYCKSSSGSEMNGVSRVGPSLDYTICPEFKSTVINISNSNSVLETPLQVMQVIFPFDSAIVNLPRNNISIISSQFAIGLTRYIDLSYNRISTVGNVIEEESGLESIKLSYNKIEEINWSHFVSKLRLKRIDLQVNKIQRLYMSDIPASLETIDISGNPLTSLTVSDSCFPKLSSLSNFKFDSFKINDCNGRIKILPKSNLSICVELPNGSAELISVHTRFYVIYSTVSVLVCVAFYIVFAVVKRSMLARMSRDTISCSQYIEHDDSDIINLRVSLSIDDSILQFDKQLIRTLQNDISANPYHLQNTEVHAVTKVHETNSKLYYNGKIQSQNVQIEQLQIANKSSTQVRTILTQAVNTIQIHCRLSHPNIVKFIGYTYTSSLLELNIITEYVAHNSITSTGSSNNNSNVSTVAALVSIPPFKANTTTNMTLGWMFNANSGSICKLQIVSNVINALVYLHDMNVIHNKIGNQSIYFTEMWECKLGNFDTSFMAELQPAVVDTSSTKAKASTVPEVVYGEKCTTKLDIFAFGEWVYSLDANNDSITINGFAKDCPSKLCDIIAKCVSRNPADRPTAAAIRHEVSKLK